ncbi:hypothetical protein N9L26_00355 [Candidatus Pacebacteria bacterium]|nr:hypothetical protein [Candidatus Paceibacterota bacterium]
MTFWQYYFCALGVAMVWAGMLSFAIAFGVPSAHAASVYYTNDNFFSTPHEQPVRFYTDGYGGFQGETESGKRFWQRAITNQFNIKLHRFEIDAAYFYVSDRGIINADTDIAALSIYFSRA